MKKILFSVVVVVMLWSCGKDDGPSTPPASAPTITGFTPKTGPVGTEVTITGTNFSTTKADNAVKFGGTAASVSTATATQLKVAVPTGAITGKISVTVDGENATSTDSFTVSTEALNQAPEMATQEFTASEVITDADEIGQITATDPDGDILTFSITDSELFVISDAGVLTLAEGKTLDYETATSHSITVSVTDGETSVEATVTITVEDVNENMADDPNSFITTWKTEADGEEIAFKIIDDYDYDFTIDWGDGTIETIQIIPEDDRVRHTYATAGTYPVAIQGTFPYFNLYNVSAVVKLISVDQWGSNEWESFANTFDAAKNMTYKATDVPNLSKATSLYGMFRGATSFDGNLSGWDTSTITNMAVMFSQATSFNGDLSGWNTANVDDMSSMFRGATSFNGDLNSWDTSNVIHMSNIFRDATSFNGDISTWITSNVVVMLSMFEGATSFNGDISGWDTSKVEDMSNMFLGATSFNGDIGGWDTSKVIDMSSMFLEASSFNGDIGEWDTGNVGIMFSMFQGATSFNVNLNGWNTVNVLDMEYMFNGAESFDQNLGGWNISNVDNMNGMLSNTAMSTTNYNATLLGWSVLGEGEVQVPTDVVLGAVGLTYCNVVWKNTLINQYGWVITDDGLDPNCP